MDRKIKASQFVIFAMFLLLLAPSLAVPATSVQEASVKEAPVPPLFKAILKADKELYSTEMKNLLQKPLDEFMEVIQFKTVEGDTIFHIMAGVQSHQPFFSREMQNLSRFFVKFEAEELSLGGISMRIPNLGNTKLTQAVQNQNLEAILSEASRLGATPAKEAIPTLLAVKFKGNFKDFVWRHLSAEQLFYLRDQGVEKIVEKYVEVFPFFLMKNKQRLSPRDIAYKSENLPAYTVLSDQNRSEDFGLKALVMGAGMGVGFVSLWLYHDFFLELLSGSINELSQAIVGTSFISASALAGMAATAKCYNLFQDKKKNELAKKIKKHKINK